MILRCDKRVLLAGALAVAMSITGISAQAQDTDILVNDFEAGTSGWFGRGDAKTTTSTASARSGSSSLLTTGRSAAWQGPGLDLREHLQPGATYEIEAFVRLAAGSGAAPITMTVQRTPSGGETKFETVAWQVPAHDADWTRVSGTYRFDSTQNDELQLYIESPDEALSYYVDDVRIIMTAAAPGGSAAVVAEAGFENGDLAGWGPRGTMDVAISDKAAHSGAASLLASNRTEAWNGPIRSIKDVVQPGRDYEFSLWLKLAEGQETAAMRVSLETATGGSAAYATLAGNRDVSADEWVEFTGSFSVAGGLDDILLYAETDSALVDFHMDDLVLKARAAPDIQADIPALKDVVSELFPIGAAIDERELAGSAAKLLKKHFNSITAENHMKPEAIQPEEGNFTFDKADALVAFAEANNMRIYGHVLVWHSQTPDWFFQDDAGQPLTDSPKHRQLALDRMKAHIEAVAAQFGERIWAWDVINEVIDDSQPDGLRRSRWYEIIGPDYVAHAFRFAREAFGPNVKLFINDYNTELPAKREAYYKLISALKADGVPIDGVGHQLHTGLARPPALTDATLTRFADLGLLQAVTELDVSISTSNEESLPSTPPDRLITQGYYYRDMMEVLRRHADKLASVTVWGLSDARSWLRYWPTQRPHEAPLLFDDLLQAKPAYWGIVDPAKLPHNPRRLKVNAADIVVDGQRELAWDYLPDVVLKAGENGAPSADFQARWQGEKLFITASIPDASKDSADKVELFYGDKKASLTRQGAVSGELSGTGAELDNGYRIEASLPMPESTKEIPFDIRATDATTGEMISWSDQNHAQDMTKERFGTLTLIDALRVVEIPKAASAPKIDGTTDPVWQNAATVRTDVRVEGASDGATADISLLWDEKTLYILAKVADPQLDKANTNPWEQDSVEVFIAPGNEKRGAFVPADGQYRISFENHPSISGDISVIGENLSSATQTTADGYIVEAAIAATELSAKQIIGLELQVNDASGGKRIAVHTWHDPTGQSYQDTKGWGVARLVDNP